MGYDYDELIERYGEGEELTDEEYIYIEKVLCDKVRKNESISHLEFEYLDECFFYDYGDIEDEAGHGWFFRTMVFRLSEKEFYGCEIPYHDDYGVDCDNIGDFYRVEKRNVVIEKWMPVEED